jgi:hypothetical protein
MPKVLTAAATVKCVHPGDVQVVASTSRLTVDGEPALVAGDLDGAAISGCKLPSSTSTAPCTATVSAMSPPSTLLTVDGTPVLLDTTAGVTNSVPPGTFSVQAAGQTRLDAT